MYLFIYVFTYLSLCFIFLFLIKFYSLNIQLLAGNDYSSCIFNSLTVFILGFFRKYKKKPHDSECYIIHLCIYINIDII
jgi:hypothetical protein